MAEPQRCVSFLRSSEVRPLELSCPVGRLRPRSATELRRRHPARVSCFNLPLFGSRERRNGCAVASPSLRSASCSASFHFSLPSALHLMINAHARSGTPARSIKVATARSASASATEARPSVFSVNLWALKTQKRMQDASNQVMCKCMSIKKRTEQRSCKNKSRGMQAKRITKANSGQWGTILQRERQRQRHLAAILLAA